MTADDVRPAEAAGHVDLAGRRVARIGYGLGALTRSAGTAAGHAGALDLVHHAHDLGVEFYDTAQCYGGGLASTLLSEALAGRRDDVPYATKVGARSVDGPVPMTAAQHPHEFRAEVEENLATLRPPGPRVPAPDRRAPRHRR